MSEKGDKLREMAVLADQEDELQEEQDRIKEDIELSKWLLTQPVLSEEDIAKNLSKDFKINLSDAKKHLELFPSEYLVQDKNIPTLIKELKQYRRTLKGEEKIRLTKSIETIIDGYSEHLDNCIKSIYWIAPYKEVLKKLRFNEQDLLKINSIKTLDERRNLVDILCKIWENDLDMKDIKYTQEYAKLFKQSKTYKKEFTTLLKNISHQSIRKSNKELIKDNIIAKVIETPGVSARQIHDNMPGYLYRRSSSNMISKMANELGITNIDGNYYKLPKEFKKDLYAYTAAFIDSDGYITMDKNFNPRVGLVATGDRGKAFMIEIQKALGIGKLHLDQKSPQNTRPVNRLNFYSQHDVRELLTKCLPHFRMKKSNAELLLELIRMKKGYKKESWYRNRVEEIYKLMKWENHKDHVNYNFAQYGIDPTTVAKLHENNKMSMMDEIEGISTPILKDDVNDAIDDLEEIADKYDLSEDEWSSVDDASDYIFEHYVLDEEE